MAIDFQNATLLNYTHQPIFFDGGLRYKIQKSFTIEGLILSLSNSSGTSPVWSGMSGLLNTANDYDAILINSNNFGSGRINDIRFNNGNDVQLKTYAVDIVCFETGNLFNAGTGFYSGIDWSNASLIDTLQETFAYNRSDNGTDSYSHNISMRLISGKNVGNPITLAKNFASGLLNNTNLTGFFGQYSSCGRNKKYYVETINLIDNSYSVNETFQTVNQSGGYTSIYTQSVNTDVNGITTVTENGNIEGIFVPLFDSARSGLNIETQNSYARCSGIFQVFAPINAYPLNPFITSKQITLNSFEGTLNYAIVFSNDPRLNTTYSWEYSQQYDKAETNIVTVTEQGTIIGYGRRLVDKYNNAVLGYAVIKPNISGRLQTFYNNNFNIPLPLYLQSSSESRSQFEGTIGYSQTYTNDNTLSGTSGIKKFDMTIDDHYPVHLTNKFNIFNFKEIIQPANQATVGVRSISMHMIGDRNNPLSGYLAFAKAQVQQPTGTDTYLNTAQYQMDIINNTFDFNCSYNYHGVFRAFDNIII